MGTVSEMVEAYQKLPPQKQQEFLRLIHVGRMCEYGYDHTPNQTTIDALNDESSGETFNSFGELLESVRAEA